MPVFNGSLEQRSTVILGKKTVSRNDFSRLISRKSEHVWCKVLILPGWRHLMCVHPTATCQGSEDASKAHHYSVRSVDAPICISTKKGVKQIKASVFLREGFGVYVCSLRGTNFPEGICFCALACFHFFFLYVTGVRVIMQQHANTDRLVLHLCCVSNECFKHMLPFIS